MSALLEVRKVSKAFGGNQVLADMDLTVQAGEIVGLLGPNGSGKSTLLNVVSGFAPPDRGTVLLNGRPIGKAGADRIARLGVRRTFQLPAMPERMSVLEVAMSASIARHGPLDSLFRPRAVAELEARTRARAEQLLDDLLLTKVASLPASAISGGQKKLLSIACAMMDTPRLLLLDEPTAGVHPNLRNDLVAQLKRIHGLGVTLVVVEHDMHFIRELCTRCIVLDRGNLIANCAPSELDKSERVLEAYLGGARNAYRIAEGT
ncbi:ABC transporter ATP-binding protein [Burkholderia sp. WAC0059]|uniref:ABC transporter ATP-binding protein n=1 Tax=Burkholderia sp. WAC0059 TaxID=2066022 RepID=UPI000C7F21CB|nr:ABC transporter ATP-binding protein [Burkholderia sp. WAC0059]PLZ00130.1 ABC transporter ATP-binding protein [Burkholderia sp. WAC0059]